MLNILCWYLAAIILIVLWSIKQWRKRPTNFPPGPVGWPVVGSAFQLKKRAEIAFQEMSQEYGPVMGVKMLRTFTVVLSSPDAVTQALAKLGSEFSGRPESVILDTLTKRRGVAGIDGPKWRENRKFGNVVMRKLGAGRAVMEDWIEQEAVYLCEELRKHEHKPFNINKPIMHAVANVICRLVVGDSFPYDDEKFVKASRALGDWFRENSNTFMILVLVPFLRHIPPFRNALATLEESRETLNDMLRPLIEKHKDQVDTDEYRDFVEAYLQEIDKTKNDPNSFYNEEDLLGFVRDLFLAGTDTTVAALRWTFVYLTNRPKVQKRIQKEIDVVIGPDGRPKMSHLDDMHYTKAVMSEMLRIRTPGPLGVPHRVIQDTKLMGFNLPKNTQVITNLWAIHHDPKLWEDPEKFDPERFLDNDGEFKPSPNLMAFSVGSRHCMGESIAKMEYFFFIVVLLQRFHLKLESDDAPPVTEVCHRSGQFLIPPEFNMRLKERFNSRRSHVHYSPTITMKKWNNL